MKSVLMIVCLIASGAAFSEEATEYAEEPILHVAAVKNQAALGLVCNLSGEEVLVKSPESCSKLKGKLTHKLLVKKVPLIKEGTERPQ